MDMLLGLGAIFADLMISPFGGASLSALLVISALLGVLLVWIYGKVSAQHRLKLVKTGISAALYEAVLYRHDLRLLLAAQGRLFAGAGRYLMVAAPPLLILALPCILLLGGLNDYYDTRGLAVGESALVDVTTDPGVSLKQLSLEAGPGVAVSLPVRQERAGQVSFMVKRTGETGATFSAQLGANGPKVQKGIARNEVASDIAVSYSVKSPWLRLLYPRSGAELATPFQSVSIGYPARQNQLFGVTIHWLLIFFVVSMIAGLLGSRVLRIEI